MLKDAWQQPKQIFGNRQSSYHNYHISNIVTSETNSELVVFKRRFKFNFHLISYLEDLAKTQRGEK